MKKRLYAFVAVISLFSAATVITTTMAKGRVEQPQPVYHMQESKTPATNLPEVKKPVIEETKQDRGEIFTVTAYDLSEQSCERPISHPHYGLTASGYSLKGHTLKSARTIAVDTDVIPLGAKVKIRFLDIKYSHLDGIYTARDTGGAIRGNKIDLFFGDFESDEPSKEAIAFGVRKAEVVILSAD